MTNNNVSNLKKKKKKKKAIHQDIVTCVYNIVACMPEDLWEVIIPTLYNQDQEIRITENLFYYQVVRCMMWREDLLALDRGPFHGNSTFGHSLPIL